MNVGCVPGLPTIQCQAPTVEFCELIKCFGLRKDCLRVLCVNPEPPIAHKTDIQVSDGVQKQRVKVSARAAKSEPMDP